MINIKKIFKDIKLQKYKSGGRAYADPVRNIFAQCTPEEEVRQKNNSVFTTKIWVCPLKELVLKNLWLM